MPLLCLTGLRRIVSVGVIALCATAASASAQLVEPNQLGLRMGHMHLNVRDVDVQKAFWIDQLGGTLVKNGPLELIQFPGVYIMLRKADNPLPPAGTIVNHFGFVVKDFPTALAKWKAAGIGIEPTENPNEVYLLGPDNLRVEVYGEPSIPEPIYMNHIHFFPSDIAGIKKWYVNAFGANPARRNCIACLSKPRVFEAADLPAVNLTFPPTAKPQEPTKGRTIDHIGFDVMNLEQFVAGLETRGVKIEAPIRQVPNSSVKVAFLTDPWGTYIELTEGLSPQ